VPTLLQDVHNYLTAYIRRYRQEWARFIAPPPNGGGYPPLDISPYLRSPALRCYLTTSAVVITDESVSPPNGWEIDGGPALVVDEPVSRVPKEIATLPRKFRGLYRIVSGGPIPSAIWNGEIPQPTAQVRTEFGDGSVLESMALSIDGPELIRRLTLGAFHLILSGFLEGNEEGEFWRPHIIRYLGFVKADRTQRRFYNYIEYTPHLSESSWDLRSLWTRVNVDVRRDYAQAFARIDRPGGWVERSSDQAVISAYGDRLTLLSQVIDDFSVLLESSEAGNEGVLQAFLLKHSILLDVYATAVPKPRFVYPRGAGVLGKEYVEPDFVLCYPGKRYKLVELESGIKPLATRSGTPRAEVTQATFQIAEWMQYIRNYYEGIKENFPGISDHAASMVIMGRKTPGAFGNRSQYDEHLRLMEHQFNVDEILTYDDLLERARAAYERLAALAPTLTYPL
jgi:hypothetical protein